METIKNNDMQHWQYWNGFKNILADTFMGSIFLNGLIYGVDWAVVFGFIGIAIASWNHIDQIVDRKRKNKQNKNKQP